jgi:hypothetical protein
MLEDHKQLSMQKMRKEVREKTLQILYNVYSLKKRLNWMTAGPSLLYCMIWRMIMIIWGMPYRKLIFLPARPTKLQKYLYL